MFIAVPLCGSIFAFVYFLWPWVLGYLRVSAHLAPEARIVVLMVIGSFLLSLGHLGPFRTL